MKLFRPDKNDKNKIFRNVMVVSLIFYMIITTILVISIFLDKDFKDFSSYFMTISTVVIASMTNYFYFVSKKEMKEQDLLFRSKKDNGDLL